MSQMVEAYVNGKQVAWTDFCAGDPPEMRSIFWEIMMLDYDTIDHDMAFAYATREQTQACIAELLNRQIDVPLTLEFLHSILPFNVVKITII